MVVRRQSHLSGRDSKSPLTRWLPSIPPSSSLLPSPPLSTVLLGACWKYSCAAVGLSINSTSVQPHTVELPEGSSALTRRSRGHPFNSSCFVARKPTSQLGAFWGPTTSVAATQPPLPPISASRSQDVRSQRLHGHRLLYVLLSHRGQGLCQQGP